MSSVTPGRETDALVAEKLGWSDMSNGMFSGELIGNPPIGGFGWIKVPRYSTVEADAISALEAVRKMGWTWFVDSAGFPGEEYRCVLMANDDDNPKTCHGDAPALCLAACRAILQLPTPHPPEPA